MKQNELVMQTSVLGVIPDHYRLIRSCEGCKWMYTKRPEYIVETLDNDKDFHCIQHGFFMKNPGITSCDDYKEDINPEATND